MLAARSDESASSKVGGFLLPISLLVAQTGKVIRPLHAGSSKEVEAIVFSSDMPVAEGFSEGEGKSRSMRQLQEKLSKRYQYSGTSP